MKRFTALLLVLVMSLGLLSGCGGGGGNESTGGESNVLKMMCVGTAADAYVPGYNKVIEDFNNSNEFGVKVEIEYIANSDYKTKLTTLMASDSEPDIIFTWELGYLEAFVNGGKIVSLQPYLDEDTAWKDSFNDGMLEQLTYNGEVYGIPTQESAAIMYYNTKIFEDNGLSVPTTYQEYLDCCETLKAAGVTPVALASTPDDAWLVSQYIQQLSNGIAGDKLFNDLKAGTGAWDDPAFIQAAELFAAEVENGYFEQGFTGVSGDEARAIFAAGNAAMYFNGSWECSNLSADAEACAVGEYVSCFTMPAVDSQYTNISVGSVDTSFAVTKNCKNVDAAVALLKHWTNTENASLLLESYSRMPSTKIDVGSLKLNALVADSIKCFGEQKALTPWFDRVNTDLGNEFNNTCVAVSNGDDIQTVFGALQQYAQSNS